MVIQKMDYQRRACVVLHRTFVEAAGVLDITFVEGLVCSQKIFGRRGGAVPGRRGCSIDVDGIVTLWTRVCQTDN